MSTRQEPVDVDQPDGSAVVDAPSTDPTDTDIPEPRSEASTEETTDDEATDPKDTTADGVQNETGGERQDKTGTTTTAAEGKAATEEQWDHFAPTPPPVRGKLRRLGAVIGRRLTHEWTLASLAGLVLAVAMTWPTLRYPTRTIPQDIWDPTLVTWMLSWPGHALTADPTQLWHGNGFVGERYSFAYTDSLLGYAPFGLVGDGPVAALLRYNIVFVLAYALATVGAYALVRQLGAGRTGAAVAAVAFAYAPWRLAHGGHLHVLSSGGIVLALAMLARGHGFSLRHGYRPERRKPWWALAGWLVAAWQLTVGFAIGLPFAYVLLLILVVATIGWSIRRTFFWGAAKPFGVKLVLADVIGGLAFASAGLLMALPYLKVLQLYPYAKRGEAEVALFSPPLRGFFTAPPESWLWGERHTAARTLLPFPAEMSLLPGFILYGLAAAGLVFSIWPILTRLLLLAGVVASVGLGMGTQFGSGGNPGYMSLYGVLPGWDAIRTPGRLVLWTTLLLGVLAAGAVSAFVERAKDIGAQKVPYRPGTLLRLATLVPLVLVLIEGANVTPHPTVPTAPVALKTLAQPILLLPAHQAYDQNYLYWSTDGYPRLVNGSSGFIPEGMQRTRDATASFPDEASIAYLRDIGVRTVVLLPGWTFGTPWERAADVPVDGLGITREERDGIVIFTLDRPD